MRKFFKMLSGGTKTPDVIEFLRQYTTDIKILVQHYTKKEVDRITIGIDFIKYKYEGEYSEHVILRIHVDGEYFNIDINSKNFSTSEKDFTNIKYMIEAKMKMKYRSE